jgi:hypothetical protein
MRLILTSASAGYKPQTRQVSYGKIILWHFMSEPKVSEPQTTRTPQMISAISGGFNTVANHLFLILPPLCLDLFLWLGPHVRIRSLAQSLINDMVSNIRSVGTPEMVTMTNSFQEMWQTVLDQFNLFSLVRTFPVGIPSLTASVGPVLSPLGTPIFYELSSFLNLFCIWFILGLSGLLFGSLYFNLVSRYVINKKTEFSFGEVGWQTLQSLALSLLVYFSFLLFSIPIFLILSILALLNSFLAQIALIIAGLILVRLLLPFVFAPHGIFAFRLNALASIINSRRLVRSYLPGTGLFLLILILISEGLNVLWRIPSEITWMTMIGIVGHAFISTGLLAGSFTYFQFGMQRMQQTTPNIIKAEQI